MDMQMVTMERDEAAHAARLYSQLINDPKRVRTEADEAALRAYKQLAKDSGAIGLVSMDAVMRRGGVHDNGLPRLAIARADTVRVQVEVGWSGSVTFSDDTMRARRSRGVGLVRSEGNVVHFGSGTLPRTANLLRASSRVPLIPPQHRPTGSLSRFHILFEVDDWTEVPVDPALLRHLGGDLWAVLAVWDLTEVERLALALDGR